MDKYMIGYCGVWYWLLWSLYDGLLRYMGDTSGKSGCNG